MKKKLKIGIIGAGNIGGALTRHFTRLGHDAVVADSRGPESLVGLARVATILVAEVGSKHLGFVGHRAYLTGASSQVKRAGQVIEEAELRTRAVPFPDNAARR